MEIINSSDFRARMATYLRKAQTSEIIIRSKEHGSFKLVPISNDDTPMEQEDFAAKIERALENVDAGNYTEVKNKEELHLFLESL